MPLAEKQLFIKKSQIPHSGMGLFTKKKIAKGTRVVEYKGKRTTWKEVDHREGSNGYIYYINRSHVIDASKNIKDFGRYANDARGLSRVKGITNNSQYTSEGLKVYIESLREIQAGGEILVGYGKEYWDIIRFNHKLEQKEMRSGSRTK